MKVLGIVGLQGTAREEIEQELVGIAPNGGATRATGISFIPPMKVLGIGGLQETTVGIEQELVDIAPVKQQRGGRP